MSAGQDKQHTSRRTSITAPAGKVLSGKQRNFSISQAASFLGVSIDTLRNWEKAGKIKSIRESGGIRRYSLTELKKTQQSHPRLIKKPNEPINKSKTPEHHIDLLNPSALAASLPMTVLLLLTITYQPAS